MVGYRNIEKMYMQMSMIGGVLGVREIPAR